MTLPRPSLNWPVRSGNYKTPKSPPNKWHRWQGRDNRQRAIHLVESIWIAHRWLHSDLNPRWLSTHQITSEVTPVTRFDKPCLCPDCGGEMMPASQPASPEQADAAMSALRDLVRLTGAHRGLWSDDQTADIMLCWLHGHGYVTEFDGRPNPPLRFVWTVNDDGPMGGRWMLSTLASFH